MHELPHKLPRDIKTTVVLKFFHGYSIHVVANELEISQSCVQRVRWKKLTCLEHFCRGRPRALSSIQERAFVCTVTLGSHDNAISTMLSLQLVM